MKKLIIYISLSATSLLLLSFLILFMPEPASPEREAVKITVGGKTASSYKSYSDLLENQPTDNNAPNIVLGDNTTVAHGDENNVYYFCGNKTSKIYHTLGCYSVKRSKEENKAYFTTSEECIAQGYKPCSICIK